MLIGLDVGGTHTDAVLLAASGGSHVASVKTLTREHSVLEGILEALAALLEGRNPALVRRVCVSSTLGLNALLSGKADPVGMLVIPGPGLDPRLFWGEDELFTVLDGAQDHRGEITAEPDTAAVCRALGAFRERGVRAVGIAGKFSPKNPALEQRIARLAEKELGKDMPLVLGARVSGALNFPRRMHTVWCNAALFRLNSAFIKALESSMRASGLTCPLVILKADAGVFSAAGAALDPASAMGSGPAASLLGTWALTPGSSAISPARRERSRIPRNEDLLMVDMGGTTTDLALLAGGHPLLARDGLKVDRRPTLVRALWTRSIALGGDSSLSIREGEPRVGPERLGPALALRPEDALSRPPTLVDALNVLGLTAIGRVETSRDALAALVPLRLSACLPPPASDSLLDGEKTPESGRLPGTGKNTGTDDLSGGKKGDPEQVRALALDFTRAALTRIRREADTLLAEVNAQPVYTIKELLVHDPLRPERAVFIGGPAAALAALAEECWELPVVVPPLSACANAVGAALARPTRTADLYADTLAGRMTISDLNIEKRIDQSYGLEQARNDLLDALARSGEATIPAAPETGPTREHSPAPAAKAQVVFAEAFAMLDDQGRRGRSIRIRAQQAAGLLAGAEGMA